MIDLGVSKLALIAVVALVVVGPERLPKIARMAGNLFSRAQRYMSEVRSEVNRQMELDEFKKLREESMSAFIFLTPYSVCRKPPGSFTIGYGVPKNFFVAILFPF